MSLNRLGAPQKFTDASTIPTTDIYAGLREILKLPQGFCLVKCDTVRPDQKKYTADDVHSIVNNYPLGGSTGGSGFPGN